MSSQKLPEPRKVCMLGLRAITTLCSAAGTAAFAIIVNNRSTNVKGTEIFFSYLPVVALGYSTFWNIFSIQTLFTGYAYFLPRRFHLGADITAAGLLLVLGLLGFVYDSTQYWKTELAPQSEKQLEIFGIVLLGLDAIMHMAFFFHGCKGVAADRTESSVAPPSYESSGFTFDDARSVRTLPEYSTDGFERISLDEKKTGITVVEAEVV